MTSAETGSFCVGGGTREVSAVKTCDEGEQRKARRMLSDVNKQTAPSVTHSEA